MIFQSKRKAKDNFTVFRFIITIMKIRSDSAPQKFVTVRYIFCTVPAAGGKGTESAASAAVLFAFLRFPYIRKGTCNSRASINCIRFSEIGLVSFYLHIHELSTFFCEYCQKSAFPAKRADLSAEKQDNFLHKHTFMHRILHILCISNVYLHIFVRTNC